jgi:hypothetical protein
VPPQHYPHVVEGDPDKSPSKAVMMLCKTTASSGADCHVSGRCDYRLSDPLAFLKWPRTYVTIMWRARNIAAV